MNARGAKTERIFRILLMIVLFLVMTILFFEQSSAVVRAGGTGERGRSLSGSYHSIKLTETDTLESLAERYNLKEVQTDAEYIDILRSVNQMAGEKLHPGCYLTVIRYRAGSDAPRRGN